MIKKNSGTQKVYHEKVCLRCVINELLRGIPSPNERLYILVDKPVGGGGSDAESNRFPVFLNDERLVTFAKIVGGVQDEKILEMLRTAKGFRRLVHSIGVSIVSDVPDKAAVFRMVFSGEHGTEGGSGKISLCTNGVETILEMACVEEQDTDAVPGKFIIEPI